ncbi:hypothetical protein M9H77_22530 [Catharanthus roseus]|uniref:Uncharacterized protein n=1 Tax=Catharanthus roseus TaxID=4058 RepID=A0ACC0AQC9_CATRO|nr:hypothetical protein M9H77_22530 [Catharanthus roseus]
MSEFRQKKGAKETFSYRKQKRVKNPKAPSASGKEVMEKEDKDENEDEESDEEDEESDTSLRESITELQIGLTTILSLFFYLFNFLFYSPHIEDINLFFHILKQSV